MLTASDVIKSGSIAVIGNTNFYSPTADPRERHDEQSDWRDAMAYGGAALMPNDLHPQSQTRAGEPDQPNDSTIFTSHAIRDPRAGFPETVNNNNGTTYAARVS